MRAAARRRCASLLLVASLTLAAASARAQSLTELLDAAAHHNVDAREAQAIAQQRTAEARQISFRLIPSIGANVTYTHNQYPAIVTIPPSPGQPAERFVIVPTEQLNLSATVNVPLIDAVAWARRDEAAATSEASTSQAAVTGLSVQRSVVTAYYNLVASEGIANSARQSIQASEAQLKLTHDRVLAGVASPVDEARSAAELESRRQTLAEAEELTATTAQTIETLTTVRPNGLPPPATDALHEEPEQRLWIASGLRKLPGIQAADANARAALLALKAAKSVFVPVVAGSITELITNASGFTGQLASYSGGVSLTERFDLTQIEGVKAADASATQAVLRADRARDNARDQIVADWQHVHALIVRVRAARSQVQANRVSEQILRDRYKAGTASSLDVQLADRDLFHSEARLIQEEASLAASRAALRLSSGVAWNAPLPDGSGP